MLSFFSLCFVSDFFEVAMIPFSFPTSMEQLACTWSIDVSRPRGHLDWDVLLGGGETFSYAEINERFKMKEQLNLYPLPTFFYTYYSPPVLIYKLRLI